MCVSRLRTQNITHSLYFGTSWIQRPKSNFIQGGPLSVELFLKLSLIFQTEEHKLIFLSGLGYV